MKILLGAVAVTIMMASTGYGQDTNARDVPSIIRNSLATNFSEDHAHWNKEGTNYEASFKLKGKEISVLFDDAGNVVETEKEIGIAELPPSVIDILKNEYSRYELEEFARIDTQGVITYEVELKQKEQSFNLIFDSDGKVIAKNMKE